MDALRGIGLLLKTPRLWPLAAGPLAGVFLIYVLLGAAGVVWLLPRFPEWLGGLPGGAWLGRLGEVAAVVAYVLLFPLFFTLLGGVLFGLIFEPLSLAVERTVAPTEAPGAAPLRWGVLLRDTLGRLLLNGFLALGAFLLGFALGPVPGVLAAALVGLLDYSSPAYLRRGLTLGPQAKRLLGRPDAATFSFALVAGLLSLVPLVGVLLMPGLIAGGTLLARRHESGTGNGIGLAAETPEKT